MGLIIRVWGIHFFQVSKQVFQTWEFPDKTSRSLESLLINKLCEAAGGRWRERHCLPPDAISVFWVRDALIRKWQQRSAIKISVFKTFQVRVVKELCDWKKKLGSLGRRIQIIWMPYILTSTANPSSPQSWVRMETDSVLSGQSEFMNHRIQNGHRTTPRPLPPLKGTLPILLYPNLIFLWTYIRVVLTRQFSQMEDSKVNLLCRKLYPRLSWRSFHLRFIHWGNG